jgi:hypothetical protein
LEEKVSYVGNWTTQINNSLGGGGRYRNFETAHRLVGLRFSKKKGDDVSEVLEVNEYGDRCSYLKSFNDVELLCKHLGNPGDIKMNKKNFEVLLEISMIRHYDQNQEWIVTSTFIIYSLRNRTEVQSRLTGKTAANQQRPTSKYKTENCVLIEKPFQ